MTTEKQTSPLNVPNALSLLRMLLVPFFVWSVLATDPMTLTGALLPAVIFAVTSFTDCLDGQIARRCHLVTNLGKFLDPLADKFMVFSALLVLCAVRDDLGVWLIAASVIIIFRDLAVTSLRLLAAGGKGVVIAASMAGKIKTVSHIAGILVLLLEPLWWDVYGATPYASYVLLAVMSLSSLLSGYDYLRGYLPLLGFGKEKKSPEAEAEERALTMAAAHLADLPPVRFSENLAIRSLLRSANYAEHGPFNVVIVGDSVSHGCFNDEIGINCDLVYHNILRLMLGKKFPNIPVNIINTAVGGVTAAYAAEHLARDVLPHRPDLVIIAYGLNDVNGEEEDYRHNMENIIARLKAEGIDCIVLTENMLNTRVDEAATPARFLAYAYKTAEMQNSGKMDAFVAAAREIAEIHSVPVTDAYALWRNMQDAGVDTTLLLCQRINHPSPAMHRVFAELLYHTIVGERAEEGRVSALDGMYKE